MEPNKPTVLFLCTHNAGRSQMAAGWMRRLAGDRVDVLSGGSTPAEQVNPAAIRYINRLSDHLFVLARWENEKGLRDVLWVPGENR